jgi:hypothetical protein
MEHPENRWLMSLAKIAFGSGLEVTRPERFGCR